MPSSLTSDLGFRLSRTLRTMRNGWGSLLEPIGLTQPQAAVLRVLDDEEDLGLRELSRIIGTDPSNLRREIDRLGQRGLIENQSPGRRGLRSALRLTEAGRQLLAQVQELSSLHHARTLGQLDQENRDALTASISQLEAILGIDEQHPSPLQR